MGKRKERRHAALLGAGRRVKLDLFAEPSGDLGGSAAEEGGGGVEKKLEVEAGLPKSPSSSGQQPANPLLLLGQYSDDDMEEGSSDGNQDTTHAESDEQIKSNGKELEELNVTSSEERLPEKDNELDVKKDAASSESLQGLGNNITGENIGATSNDVSHEKHLEPLQNSVPLASDVHAAGEDLKSSWKMVLHEESNSYYYWNTVTGETSWEVPADLAQVAAPLVSEPQTSLAGDNSHRDMDGSGAIGSANEVSYSLFPSGSQIPLSIQDCKGDESQLISTPSAIGAFHQENLTLGNYSSYVPPTDPFVGSWVATPAVSNTYTHGEIANNQDDTDVADLPSRLVRRSESLLEKLRSLRGFKGNSDEQHAWTSKYISEIEIRLFDLNSLLSCGPSLAPFWLHSEMQLKRLEDALNSEIGSYVEFELKNETNSLHLPSYDVREAKEENREEREENREGETDPVEELKKGVVPSGKSCDELDDVQLPSDVPESIPDGASCDGIPSIKQGPELASDRTQSREEENISNEATVFANVNFEPELHPVEEEDMDIDMEVEDTSLPSDATATGTVYNHTLPSEQLDQPPQPIAPADKQSLASEVEYIAPPPDDDWIPPLPPDNEEIPPPPPDEPPESFGVPAPPSYPEPMQTISYPAGYSLTYPDPNYSYYVHAGVPLPNQPVYYETVPSSIAEAAGTLSNHVGSAVYYVQDPAAHVVATEAPSTFQVALPPGYDGISSNLSGTDGGQAQMASFDNSTADAYTLQGRAEPIISQASNPSISATACATTQESISASHASYSASVASTAPSTVSDLSATAAKPQPKASRAKKRTVAVASSLRSNKKVSSLVDKWKAAKEEMEEADEEDADNALMVLEKKRQREIEEWQAYQIASGEAKDNANFQPLGGDWREKVRRKRARRAASAEKTPAEVTVAEKKQPKLSEHSNGLPPGWQSYWDESSKQVYYGNVITSETTWTRPT